MSNFVLMRIAFCRGVERGRVRENPGNKVEVALHGKRNLNKWT